MSNPLVLEGNAVLDCSDPYEPWYIEINGKEITAAVIKWMEDKAHDTNPWGERAGNHPAALGKLRVTVERLVD